MKAISYLMAEDGQQHAYVLPYEEEDRSLCGAESMPQRWREMPIPIIDLEMDLCPKCREREKEREALEMLAGTDQEAAFSWDVRAGCLRFFSGGEWKVVGAA